MREAIAGFQGKVFLYAKNLETGATYGIRENERVRTASTIKLPIMVTVFQTVADGQAKFSEELTLHDADKVIRFGGDDGVFGRREAADSRRHAPDDRAQ